jgi:hypothetical protein
MRQILASVFLGVAGGLATALYGPVLSLSVAGLIFVGVYLALSIVLRGDR